MKNGYFGTALGEYVLNRLPKAGLYEYIYKNDKILLKLDQYGVQTCQIDPPIGIALVKREPRENASPIKLYVSMNGETFDNFNAFKADRFSVNFQPHKAVYALTFGTLNVTTEWIVPPDSRKFIMRVSLENTGDVALDLRVMPCAYPYVNALMMAPWDKPEWYTRTEFFEGDGARFTTTRYSVGGNAAERRYFSMLTDLQCSSFELSEERLLTATNNYTVVPDSFSGETQKELYAFGQCFAGISKLTIAPKQTATVHCAFTATLAGEDVERDIRDTKRYFSAESFLAAEKELQARFAKLFSVRSIATNDKTFDTFVNGFLPLELDWVSALDRGWPTGMRGVRDASNDFEGYIDYNKTACRNVIENIFSKQRSDGWYPRQVPFGGDKFDLRHFVDSACFFTEYVYDYLAATEDYALLQEKFGYYDDENRSESGFEHLKKGVEYLFRADNLGEHGLVKMQGGDWLDCLNGAGIRGRGETVMVSCQLVMCLRYLAEITRKIGNDGDEYMARAKKIAAAINACAYNDKGFYNGVFTDDGAWIFSDCDPDGEERVYVPTNSYAIISGVANGKEESIIRHVETLKTSEGYRLFSVPFGKKKIDGIGKMGTGDFQPYFAENASVYNHGSQLFYARALAKAGEFEKLYDVLNYAMPFNETLHKESSVCAAPYAITNCYHLVPSFYGRTGFSFLTGSVAMIERAVYNWMFGVQFTLDSLVFAPCIPKQYQDANVQMRYNERPLYVTYVGYGNTVEAATLNGRALAVKDGKAIVPKSALQNERELRFTVTVGC